jgi:hypothetical protein
MKTKFSWNWAGISSGLVLVCLTLVLTGCGSSNIAQLPSGSGYQATEIKNASWASIKELKMLDALVVGRWDSLLNNGYVKTNTDGIARVRNTGKNCDAYLYMKSGLKQGTCTLNSVSDWMCTAGAASVSNCNISLQSASADIKTKGTWYSVITLEDQELTLVIVSDGEVEVIPATRLEFSYAENGEAQSFELDFNRRDMDENQSVLLVKGLALFTASDEYLERLFAEVPGLPPPRTPLQPEDLQRLLTLMIERSPQLGPWIEEIRSRSQSEVDYFPPIERPVEQPREPELPLLVFSGRGGWLEDPGLQDVLLIGINWQEIQPQALLGSPAEMIFEFSQRDGRLVEQSFNPGLAAEMVKNEGLDRAPVSVVLLDGDPGLSALGDRLIDDLQRLNIPVETTLVPFSDFYNKINTMIQAGESVLWYDRR